MMLKVLCGAAVVATGVLAENAARLGTKGGHFDDEGYGPDGFDLFGFDRQGIDAWGRRHDDPLAGLIPPVELFAATSTGIGTAAVETMADGVVVAAGMANVLQAHEWKEAPEAAPTTTKTTKTKKPKKSKKPKKAKKSKSKKPKKSKKVNIMNRQNQEPIVEPTPMATDFTFVSPTDLLTDVFATPTDVFVF